MTNPTFSQWCDEVKRQGITSVFLVERPDLRQWTAFVTIKTKGFGLVPPTITQEFRASGHEEVLLAIVGWRKTP